MYVRFEARGSMCLPEQSSESARRRGGHLCRSVPIYGEERGGKMSLDQATWRRTRKLGLTCHEPSRAFPGYTLFAPMFGDGTVHLIDMDGNEVHRWTLPFPPGDYGYLLPNGNLFYLGKTPAEPDTFFPVWPVFKGGALLEVDWDGTIVWEHRDQAHHHDGRRTASGGAIYLTADEMPSSLIPKVRGGL